MSTPVEIGKTYAVRFPFCLEDVELPPEDAESAPVTTKSWRPGVTFEHTDNFGGTEAAADAFGEMLLTVVDVHKPGRFPTRVFYTRQWKDPTGKVFGKGALRITTQDAFRRKASRYQHEVYVDGELFVEPAGRSEG